MLLYVINDCFFSYFKNLSLLFFSFKKELYVFYIFTTNHDSKIGIMMSSKQPPAGQNKDYLHACFKFISIILL